MMGPLLGIVYGLTTKKRELLWKAVYSETLLGVAAVGCGFLLTLTVFGHVRMIEEILVSFVTT
jgi:hypothetical protein